MNSEIMVDLDIADIRLDARYAWENQQERHAGKRKMSVQQLIANSVPYWLIIIALGLFVLSAPHTAEMFGKLMPYAWLGWAAPFVVELTLMFTAFTRHQSGGKLPWDFFVLECLMFIAAVIVNGTGAFSSVVEKVGLHDASTRVIIASFADIPATSQAAFALVPLAALMVPLGALMTGGGLARLVLDQKQRDSADALEAQWLLVADEREFYAIRDAALRSGYAPDDANDYAYALTEWDGAPKATKKRSLEIARATRKSLEISRDIPRDELISRDERTVSVDIQRKMDNPEKALRHLTDNPLDIHLKVDVFTAKLGIPRSTAGKAMTAYKDGWRWYLGENEARRIVNEDTNPTEAIPDDIMEARA